MNKGLKFLINNKRLLIQITLSLVLSLSVLKLFHMVMGSDYLSTIIVFIAVSQIVNVGTRAFTKKRLFASLLCSIPFGLAFFFGRKIAENGAAMGGVEIMDLVLIPSIIALFCLASMTLLMYIDKYSFVPRKKVFLGSWWKYSLILILCWAPLFLAFFPGVVSNDTAVQIKQAIGEGSWSNWHPVAHTAFMALPITIGFNLFGDLTAGIAFATIVQMVVLSLIYGYTIKWVINKTSKKWIGYLMVAFFATCPVVACYSITLWKDVIFSSIFLLLIIKLFDLIFDYRRIDGIPIVKIIAVFILGTLAAFFRNGGIIVVLTTLVAMFVYFKKNRGAVLGVGIASLAIIIIVQGLLFGLIGIEDTPFMESMSIPAQQIGYVVSHDDLSEEEALLLSKYVDIEEIGSNYDPFNADPAKRSFDYGEVNNDKIGFLCTWFAVMWKHFGSYLASYMLQTYSYWYIGGTSWSISLEHNHESIWMEEKYNDVALLGDEMRSLIRKTEYGIVGTSFLGWIASVGVMFWGIIYMVIVFMYQKRYYTLVPLSCILMYMASLLIASPVSSIFRYVFSLMLCLPILVTVCFCKVKIGAKK